MRDKLIMENYLLLLKSNMEVYVHGTLESSNKKVRDLLNKGMNLTLTSQNDTFNLMESNNWYQTQNISSKEIKKLLNNID